jgi:hypothetical protein
VGWKTPTIVTALVVVALTVLASVIGLAISGPWGLVAGGVVLALATLVAGYVPAIRGSVKARRSELDAARAEWDAIGEPVASGAATGPAGLLRPERAIVEFTGREAELAELRVWYESVGSGPVRVLVGAWRGR